MASEPQQPTAVVTGASRGIGLAVTRRLLADGFAVAALSRHMSEALVQLEADGHPLRHFALDLADQAIVTASALAVCRAYPSIGVLVNCAGMAVGGLFAMTTPEAMRTVFTVNVFNQILFSQYIAKKMMRGKHGAIVNIGSTAGLRADAGTLAYGGSKAAMLHATRVMATELGPHGIRVNAIAPSVVDTDMALQMSEHARGRLDDRSALKGPIVTEDVADLAAFLASDKAAKITGQIIRLDRGLE